MKIKADTACGPAVKNNTVYSLIFKKKPRVGILKILHYVNGKQGLKTHNRF